MAREKLAALAIKASSDHLDRSRAQRPKLENVLGKTLGGAALPGAGDAESSFAGVIATLSAVETRGQSIEPEDHAALAMPGQLQRHPERS